MIKRLIALGGVAAALLAFAIPSLACYGSFCFHSTETNSVSLNIATQAISNTGGNTQLNAITVEKASDIEIGGRGTGTISQGISTGAAYADAKSLVIANADPCGCFSSSACLTSNTVNAVGIEGITAAQADTGLNIQQISTDVSMAHDVEIKPVGGSSSIVTGPSSSVVRSRTLVNVMPIMWN